jgi:hypothetical protein
MTILPAVQHSIFSAFQPATAALHRLAARYLAGLAIMMHGGTRRLDEPNDVRPDDRHLWFVGNPRSPLRQTDHTPRGIFHPLLASLTGDAARISVAIRRHAHLRRQFDQAD